MKNLLLFSVLLLLVSSCCLFDFNKGSGSNTLTGSSEIAINTVGNDFKPSIRIGNSYLNTKSSITIKSVENGIATVNFKTELPKDEPLLEGIKPKYKDANGNLDCVGTYKFTDEGIMDYNNPGHEPFVLVKYDGKVGDKYTLEKDDGTVITREIVRKSTEDDFYWGGMIIKTTDVEQDSRIPGIEKLVYYTNHKFGLVAVQAVMEDGSSNWLNLNPTNY
jgi:hypothetical protein